MERLGFGGPDAESEEIGGALSASFCFFLLPSAKYVEARKVVGPARFGPGST